MATEYIDRDYVKIQLKGQWYHIPTIELARDPHIINAMDYLDNVRTEFQVIRGIDAKIPAGVSDEAFLDAFMEFVEGLEHPIAELRRTLLDKFGKLHDILQIYQIPENNG